VNLLIFAAKLLGVNLFNGYDQSAQMTMVIIPLFQLLEHFVEEYFDQTNDHGYYSSFSAIRTFCRRIL
jgi:hypothetical protein